MYYSSIAPLIGCLLLCTTVATAQDIWPKDIPLSSGGKITIYQPQPEDLQGNLLAARAAVSVRRQLLVPVQFDHQWLGADEQVAEESQLAGQGIKESC